MRQVTVGGGHAGGQALPLHFGLGAATSAQVRVDWPDGSLSEVTVPANQILTLTR
jgi:hypothetical protein